MGEGILTGKEKEKDKAGERHAAGVFMNIAPIEAASRDTLDTIRRMAVLAQYRKPGLIAHLERVRSYCYLLARAAGLPEANARVLSFASQLHDVGEIAIPKEVLTKSTELLPYEWELVKQHTIIGAEILRGSPSVIIQAGEVIALTHHERWDGSGYPHGLKGEDIPIGGRICAVADVFDALTTPRPYKAEMKVDDALTLLQTSGQAMFDPRLVEIFCQNYEELVKIRTQAWTSDEARSPAAN
jgi:putative two-component system response regulator